MTGADGAVVHLPISGKHRAAGEMRVSARLLASGVDMEWLKAGLKKWLSTGRASVRQMASVQLMPAGRGDALSDTELTVKVVDDGAQRLLDADCYGWLSVGIP